LGREEDTQRDKDRARTAMRACIYICKRGEGRDTRERDRQTDR